MPARKSSLRELAANAKDEKLAAANSGAVGNRIMEISPDLVHAGGLTDRMTTNSASDAAEIRKLAASLKGVGQKVPILVRPHPDRPGEFQIVAGRRRLAACREAGLAVRAEVQDLDDRDLVLGQAIENIAREDLTYIERARLAVRMVEEVGLKPADIDLAFSCGKTDRSRYLKIGRSIPNDILDLIGKAPGIGRPRWEELAGGLTKDTSAEQRVREKLAAANTSGKEGASETRFAQALKAALSANSDAGGTEGPDGPPERSQSAQRQEIYVPGYEAPVGRLKTSKRGVQLTLHAGHQPGFTDWVESHRDEIVARLMHEHAEALGSKSSE